MDVRDDGIKIVSCDMISWILVSNTNTNTQLVIRMIVEHVG